jgi:hypothetical protein
MTTFTNTYDLMRNKKDTLASARYRRTIPMSLAKIVKSERKNKDNFWNKANAKRQPCVTVFKAEPIRLAVDNTRVTSHDTKAVSLKKAA